MSEHHAACQCGQLNLVAKSDPEFVIACNCRACQRRSGSPFGTGAYYRKDAVEISGIAKKWERKADSGRALVNHFCGDCGTNLFWSLEMRPDYFGIGAGSFDGPLPKPARVIWTEEKHAWVEFPHDMPSFPRGTPE